jgi:predicted nuclease of predicted toxin-antitoxin system
MKLKLDENMPAIALPLLAEWGHDVTTASEEGLAGRDDPTVAERVTLEGRMLITLDRGFGNIRAYPPGDHPGIIVLRLPDQRPDRVAASLRSLLYRGQLDDLAGCTVVVEPGRLRVRRPER